jgi:hypothetical protein
MTMQRLIDWVLAIVFTLAFLGITGNLDRFAN